MYAATLRSEPAPGPEAPRGLQRSQGRLDLVIEADGEISRPTRIYQQGCIRVRFPNPPPGGPIEAVLLGLTGGLTGGDNVEISVNVGPGAVATLTSQACERIYRSRGSNANFTAALRVGDRGRLDYLPQPTLLFHGGRLVRETRFELSGTSAMLAVEAVIFGRTAMNETVRDGLFSDSCFVRRDGKLIHADRFLLEGDIQAALDRPSLLGGGRAMAALRYIAPDAPTRLGQMREVLETVECEAAASAWDGMLLARLVAEDGFRLQRALLHLLAGFNGAPPRMWLL